jgi:hypothetical protein
MTQITVDTTIGEQFSTLSDRSEIRDEAGRLLGYFVPPGDALSETIELPYTIEELEAAEREGGGRPLAEILRDLEQRS